jgi:predicted O-linked N-acetylglucosamine transferase (SPINDLY family)
MPADECIEFPSPSLPILLGIAVHHHASGALSEAEHLCHRILDADPHSVEALQLLGILHGTAGRNEQALEWIDRAITCAPGRADLQLNRAIALGRLQRWRQALVDADRALQLAPNSLPALQTRGKILYRLRRFEEALHCFDAALQRQPKHPDRMDLLTLRASTLLELQRFPQALADLECVLGLEANHVQANCLLGNLHLAVDQLDSALEIYEAVLRLDPAHEYARINAESAMDRACDWEDHVGRIQALRRAIRSGERVLRPFDLLHLLDEPELHRQVAERWHARHPCNLPASLAAPAPPGKRRIHVAYVCAEFHLHATTILMAQVLEMHDRDRFELTGISLGRKADDPMRERVLKALDRFIDVHQADDEHIVGLCRHLGIDIAVNLNGLVIAGRNDVWAARCAPIQVNWLAYPGTMGASFMDYIVADRTLITDDDLAHYSEKVIWLPHTYQPNDGQRRIADATPSRQVCGLPQQGFVFCCFNNSRKIQPQTFDVWMRILLRVPQSVLWLLSDSQLTMANLRREAGARGVDPGRLVFAQPLSPPEHLARHALADLFLDTWPYNAHTTASDALWAGLPVLTCQGRSFQARVAASLLQAIGLPDLITHTSVAYEELAVALAQDPVRLAELKSRLRAHRLSYPLFDCARFTRNLEWAYTRILARHQAGQAPDHLMVPDQQPAQATPKPDISARPRQTAR